MTTTDQLTWQDHGNCRGVDPDLMFPERGQSTRAAKAVCAECTVRDECLEYAITNCERFGIWGGLSERERRHVRRDRDRVCLQCEQPFDPDTPYTKVCSDECRDERDRARAARYQQKRAS